MAVTKCLVLISQLALLGVTVHAAPTVGVTCLDQNAKQVDWWVTYKLPTVNGNAQSNDGYGFAYTDAKTPFAITGKSLKDEDNAMGHTLNQIYESKDTGYVMWNDETPDGKTTSSQAHAKGVMGFDNKGGFLLRHSTPRFPENKKTGYEGLPDNEKIYGQTYICVSVDLPTLNNLAGQYLVAHPLIYDFDMAGATNLPNVTKLTAGGFEKVTNQAVLQFKTIGGTPMTDIVKSSRCSCDLWDAIVSPFYKQSMNVLTWGRPLATSGCQLKTTFNVQNINAITWGSSLSYLETNEHSKWGVTSDKNVLCIGDINRMLSQRKRGGGATCFTAPKQATAFASLVKGVESCTQ